MNLDLMNVAILYIHDDERTASEAYRRYKDYVSGDLTKPEHLPHRRATTSLALQSGCSGEEK